MLEPFILHDVDARGVGQITLNRPDKRNALSEEMVNELRRIIEHFSNDEKVRILVLRANGSHFCAGGDLNWFLESFDDTREGRVRRSAVLGDLLQALYDFPKPLIGRIQGSALGGGTGLVAVCDIALGLKGARFGFPETRLGLIPATFLPYVMRRIGEAKARAVMLSGAQFSGTRAEMIGLIEEAHEDIEALDLRLEQLTNEHLAASDEAMRMTKDMITRTAALSIADAASWLALLVGNAWENREARERISILLEKSR